MKYAGMTGLILCTTAIGYLLSETARRRVLLCRELLVFCDRLSQEIVTRKTPVKEILAKYPLQYLEITDEYITDKRAIHSPLSTEDSRFLSDFFYSLGKSDGKAQRVFIDGCREYIKNALTEYEAAYRKNARLYLSFGFFGGVLLSAVLL